MNWAEYSGSEEEKTEEIPREHSQVKEKDDSDRPQGKPYTQKKRNPRPPQKPRKASQPCSLISRIHG